MHLRVKVLLALFICICTCNAYAQSRVQIPAFPLLFEKAYLHTDREQYLAGEDVWFKAYLVNGQTQQLINISNNLYVELIAPGGVIRDKKLVRMENGLGHGDMKLSQRLVPGIYRLRAYTNWMRNFGNSLVFEKEIRIYSDNTLGVNAPARMAAILPKNAQQTIAPASIIRIPGDTLRFFPEGGSMVENISAKVAFKAEDRYGRNIGIKGNIQTASGENVVDLNSEAGIGKFTFKPLPGVEYTAKGTYADGRTFSVPMPRALLKGLAMHVQNGETAIKVTIQADPETLSALQNKMIALYGRCRAVVYYEKKDILLTGPATTVQVSINNFPEGVACFTLVDNNRHPVCERLVYIDGENNLVMHAATDKSSYAPKEKTTLTVTAPPQTHLSVSVTDANLVAANKLDIRSYLYLQSEVRGKIENLPQYFDMSNPNRTQQLDLLLMTQGWRDFLWRRLADSALRISYIAEKGITLNGNVKEEWSGKPIPGLNITLFADSAIGQKIFAAKTDSSGHFFVDGVNLYGKQLFSANGINDKGKSRGVISVDTVTGGKLPALKKTYPPDTIATTGSFKNIIAERLNITRRFSIKDTVRLNEVKITNHPLTIVGDYADTTIVVDRKDYKYRTLGAYAGMLYAKYRQRFPAKVSPKLVFTSDSVPALRTKFVDFINMPLTQIVSIHCRAVKVSGAGSIKQQEQGFSFDLMNPPYGDHLWIDIVIRPHALDSYNPHSAHLDVLGYYQARTFYAPQYTTPDTKPDVRTTIHWEPDVVTDNKGIATITYYNADPKTRVNIVAEGVTEAGTPVVATASYVVK